MLLSMTGFGEAHCQQDGLTVAVEVRAINSRYFKLSLRTSDGYSAMEPAVEAAVRMVIRRGTIQVGIRVDRAPSPDDFRINVDVLGAYRSQLEGMRQERKMDGDVSLEHLLLLPGVVDDSAMARRSDASADGPLILGTLETALQNLQEMRADEGRNMAADLEINRQAIADGLGHVKELAPRVVDAYRERLEERLKKTLDRYDIELQPADIIREISLFGERVDISEEMVRLQSHIDQFAAIMERPESSGRKLEFLTQELLRETNTIGSKANDVEIAQHVIEIKAAIERIREMIQNIE